MVILSLNVAKPMIIHRGVEAVETGICKLPVAGTLQVTELGFSEDSIIDLNVHGGPDQALYLYTQEDYDWWSEQLGKSVEAGAFGENITLTGVDLSECKVGDRLQFDEVILEITAPRIPCFKLANRMGDPGFVKRFVQARRPGAYARVVQTGTLAAGMKGTLTPTTEDYIATKAVFMAWHGEGRNKALQQQALNSPLSIHQKRVIGTWAEV